MNFKKVTFKDKFSKVVDTNTSKKQSNILNKEIKLSSLSNLFKLDFNTTLTNTERWMLRVAGGMFALFIMYTAISVYLNNAITSKRQDILAVKRDTEAQILAVSSDIAAVKAKTNKYQQLANNLNNIRAQLMENDRNRKIIPALLTQLQVAIPQGVQLTSIENTSGKHIVIYAQSQKYEQLGYFKAILKTQGILAPDTIVSSAGEKQGDLVKVVIEGDLP